MLIGCARVSTTDWELILHLEAQQMDLQSLTDGINAKRVASRFLGMFFAFLHGMNAIDTARSAGRVGGYPYTVATFQPGSAIREQSFQKRQDHPEHLGA